MPRPFWETKSLREMTLEEWESLCDRCGRCCLHKIEDIDTGEILSTNVVCDLFDLERGKCTRYRIRQQLVPDCMDLKENFPPLNWLPSTCAYRLIAEGNPLPGWHPLISGDSESVHDAGVSIRSFAIPESDVDKITDHVVEGLL
ncbi:MAG: YcgN family cysteine cluster protein [Methylothermaceae bacterium]|nr:YcgN family cysteine cluster protein [Methylothermaceae bacterium]